MSCSRSTSFDSAFPQRRAPLPIIETQKSPWNVSDVDRSVNRKNVEEKNRPKNCKGQVFSRTKKCFSTASHPDEALPVFALFLAAGVAAYRRRAGRAGRHRPVCWLELATRQIHADARSAQLASALGTSPVRPHPEPPRGPLSLTSCSHSSRHEARRTCSPATWPSSAASRDASRRKRAPLLPAPSLMAPSTA